MCTTPPTPPPPLPQTLQEKQSKNSVCPKNIQSDICLWAKESYELWEACTRNNICCNMAPFKFKYKYFESIIQVGPTCGMVALSMLVNGDVTANEMLEISRSEGYSNNGEMLSCKNMLHLSENVFKLLKIDITCRIESNLFSDEIIDRLLDGAVLLVAYDADYNHSPCLRRGHTAHWALVCGVIIAEDLGGSFVSNPSNVYVLCKHGKSRLLTVWRLDMLDKSNKNLHEFSPKKLSDGLHYILPDGGIGGKNGLRDQFILFEGFHKVKCSSS